MFSKILLTVFIVVGLVSGSTLKDHRFYTFQYLNIIGHVTRSQKEEFTRVRTDYEMTRKTVEHVLEKKVGISAKVNPAALGELFTELKASSTRHATDSVVQVDESGFNDQRTWKGSLELSETVNYGSNIFGILQERVLVQFHDELVGLVLNEEIVDTTQPHFPRYLKNILSATHYDSSMSTVAAKFLESDDYNKILANVGKYQTLKLDSSDLALNHRVPIYSHAGTRYASNEDARSYSSLRQERALHYSPSNSIGTPVWDCYRENAPGRVPLFRYRYNELKYPYHVYSTKEENREKEAVLCYIAQRQTGNMVPLTCYTRGYTIINGEPQRHQMCVTDSQAPNHNYVEPKVLGYVFPHA